MTDELPRITFGAATSGSGKTLFCTLLGRLLTAEGRKVQPFKCGPDYIDPSYHSIACGRDGRNLDTRLTGADAVLELFSRAAADADISIIEGVMGLYDGAGALDERGSTADLAKLLRSPAVLLMDVSATARSAAATALGFRDFDPDLELKGFILNRVASPRHEEMVRKAVEDRTGLPVLGALPRAGALAMPERHLGLVPAWEGDEILEFLDSNIGLLKQSVDTEALNRIAADAPPLPEFTPEIFRGQPPAKDTEPVRIAYAYDRAFHFYYRDNLDLLENRGVELVSFSPLADSSLPEDIGGIYIGGGYPELSAAELARNESMKSCIRQASGAGMPVWAECGGLMYLLEELTDFDGKTFKMAGVFRGCSRMKRSLRALGYYNGKLLADTWMGPEGTGLTGHVFHWSETTDFGGESEYVMRIEKETDGSPIEGFDGFYKDRSWAGYMHIHFASNPEIAENFIGACRDYAAAGGEKNERNRNNK